MSVEGIAKLRSTPCCCRSLSKGVRCRKGRVHECGSLAVEAESEVVVISALTMGSETKDELST